MRLKTYKMAMSILPKSLTVKWNISRTIWRIEVGDGSFYCIFHALSFGRNFFFDRRFPSSTKMRLNCYYMIIKSTFLHLTKLTKIDETISKCHTKIDGYNHERYDRNRHGGGVCIYINLQLTRHSLTSGWPRANFSRNQTIRPQVFYLYCLVQII